MEESNERKEETRNGQQYAELLCDFMFKRLFGSEGMYLLKHIYEMDSMPEVGKFFSSVNASGALKGDSVLKQSSLVMEVPRLLCF